MRYKLLLLLSLFSVNIFAQQTYIPDDAFEQYLIDIGCDDVLDDYVLTESIDTIYYVTVSNIGTLEGIKEFSSLRGLEINTLSQEGQLDIGGLEYLESLTIYNATELQQLYMKNITVSSMYNLSLNNVPKLNCVVMSNPEDGRMLIWDSNIYIVSSDKYCPIPAPEGYTKIPDNGFENALIALGYDDVIDQLVLTDNIKDIVDLDISNSQISDLVGLEDFISLETLNCRGNYINTIDLTYNTKITSLDVQENVLETLELNNLSDLEILDCKNNSITNIYGLDNLTKLKEFDAVGNKLSNLYLDNLDKLTKIDLASNSLKYFRIQNGNNTIVTSLDLTNNPDLSCVFVDDRNYSSSNWTNIDFTQTFVETDAQCNDTYGLTYVPDDNFEQELIDLGYDDVLNDSVKTANIKNISNLKLDDWSNKIDDITGIEDFTGLYKLEIYNQNITTIDVSTLKSLTRLYIQNNELTSLDLSGLIGLRDVSVQNNEITEVIFPSDNSSLSTIEVMNNKLTSIDISKLNYLYQINIGSNAITEIDASHNQFLNALLAENCSLTSVDISNATQLKTLRLTNNSLTNLNLENNSNITELRLNNNPFEGDWDFRHLTQLQELELRSSKLTSLDLRNGTESLTTVDFLYNSNLHCVFVNDFEKVRSKTSWLWRIDGDSYYVETEQQCSELDEYTLIPDSNFEQALIDNPLGGLDDVIDGKVLRSTIRSVKTLYLNDKGITDLSGIEDFERLEIMYAKNNALTSLDLNINGIMTGLYCQNNSISKLKLPTLPYYLEYLDVSDNNLTELNFGKIKFKDLKCDNNSLNYLNIRNGANNATWSDPNDAWNNLSVTFSALNNPNLHCIFVDDATSATDKWNTNIDATSSFAETEGDCTLDPSLFTYVPDNNFEQNLINLGYDNILDDYVVTANIEAVTNLDLSNKSISDLTGIEGFEDLKELRCNYNSLTSIDVSNNVKLEVLLVNHNNLTSIDITALPNLRIFGCGYNNDIATLDVSNNTWLYQLQYSGNKIKDIDLIQNIKLERLYIEKNEISSIDLSKNVKLRDIYFQYNEIVNIDFSHNTDLRFVFGYQNNLTSVDFTNNTKLTKLDLNHNNLSSLDIRIGNNNIDDFNVRNNPSLGCIYVSDAEYFWDNFGLKIDLTSQFSNNESECSSTSDSDFVVIGDRVWEQQLVDLRLDDTIDGKIRRKFIIDLKEMKIDLPGIDDLTGIGGFGGLNKLELLGGLSPLGKNNNSGLKELDLSSNTDLIEFTCKNSLLELVNLKNGNNDNFTKLSLRNNPGLTCVVVDNVAYSETNWRDKQAQNKFISDNSECSTLSLNDINIDIQISIYPNPARNYITVKSSSKVIEVIIYDNLGREVTSFIDEETYDISHIESGIYNVVIQTVDGRGINRLIIE